METKDVILLASTCLSLLSLVHVVMKNRADKINRTMELARTFYDNDMLDARVVGWVMLGSIMTKSPRPTFKTLWDVSGYKEQMDFEKLYKVLSFGHTVIETGNKGEINLPLAKGLFSYEYEYWRSRVHPLLVATAKSAEDMPDALSCFEQEVVWLMDKERSKRRPLPLN